MNLKTTVDKLGQIRAQIADLKAAEEQLKERLLGAKVTEAEGKLFHATIVTSTVRTVDYKSLLDVLAPPEHLVQKYTTEGTRTQVRVTARSSS